MNYRWLTENDLIAYSELVCTVAEAMEANNQSHMVDFLPAAECHKAIREGRVYSLWDNDNLVITLIAGTCNLGQIYDGQFDDLDGSAVYLRNGMVHPDYVGQGLYSQFMQAISREIDGDLVGTIRLDNKAAQYACASAGFTTIVTVPYLKKDASVVLMCRAQVATEIAAEAA